jgi:hypothetical protein
MVSPNDHVVMNHQNQTRTIGIWGHVRYSLWPVVHFMKKLICIYLDFYHLGADVLNSEFLLLGWCTPCTPVSVISSVWSSISCSKLQAWSFRAQDSFSNFYQLLMLFWLVWKCKPENAICPYNMQSLYDVIRVLLTLDDCWNIFQKTMWKLHFRSNRAAILIYMHLEHIRKMKISSSFRFFTKKQPT